MKKLSVNQLRKAFLDFFASKNHTIVNSASLIPTNDPTLMFTAAGMVPFKDMFTGVEKRDYVRATASQRCVRAGGKHNDLENVGRTARHHTFFEMMGNFSFGDYFKDDAIPWAWEFLTEVLEIPAEKLLVTVYHTDDEAYEIWKKVGVPEERIIKISSDDNFWSAGDTGPCGPCTEIFYDHGADIWGDVPGSKDEDGDRYIEIWNIVFMQFDRQADGTMPNLPQTGVDTGCGLERLAAIMQGEHNNYETDSFAGIIETTAELVGLTNIDGEELISLRVIADHLRAMTFLLVDGVLPSNEGRGYVLRRIMRRAMRHAYLLEVTQPIIYKLVPSLIEIMGEAYPELERGKSMIVEVIKAEEERFGKTLAKGMKLLDEAREKLGEGDVLAGDVAFKLYDTYGFPLDLTQDALKPHKIEVDINGFEKCMEEQRQRAKAAGMGGTGQAKLSPIWFEVKERVGATEFVGYELEEAKTQVLALVKDEQEVASLQAGESGVVIVKQTPFYAESGGQVGDAGYTRVVFANGGKGSASQGGDGVSVKIIDTQKVIDGSLYLHFVEVKEGELKVGDEVGLAVDSERRGAIKANHSATHLLNSALKKVLGDHVVQRGSLVTAEKLRFDFSNPKGLTQEQIAEVENEVNQMVRVNASVDIKSMGKEDAIQAGAEAQFGEKYGDEVRVVKMDTLSTELCGGNHVGRTGDIGMFKILSDSSIASGIRRVEAVTGQEALELSRNNDLTIKSLAGLLKVKPEELSVKIAEMQKEQKKLKKELKTAQKSGGGASGGSKVSELASQVETIGKVKFLGAEVQVEEVAELREMVEELKVKLASGIVVLATNIGEKSSVVVGVTKDLTGDYPAGKLVNIAAESLGGRGGGRPDMAMAGGKSGDLKVAIEKVRSEV